MRRDVDEAAKKVGTRLQNVRFEPLPGAPPRGGWMNAAYLKRCVDEERRAKIAAGFTMYATTRSPTTAHHPPIASPPFPIPRVALKNSLRSPTTRVLITATA